MYINFHVVWRPALDVCCVVLRRANAQRLPGNPTHRGTRSILLAKEGRFDADSSNLTIDLEDVEVLTIGSTDVAWILYDPVSVRGADASNTNLDPFDSPHYPLEGSLCE